MYKSSFLWNLSRAGRHHHPFFTQNVNGANSTALSLVQPKLGLGAEKTYFSSWGSNGQSASNLGASTNSQSVLVAVSSDDSRQWERELGLHRKQFRSIAGIRRYSTGDQSATATSTEQGILQLTGDHITKVEAHDHDVEDAAIADQELSPRETTTTKAIDIAEHDSVATLVADLQELYDQGAYLQLLQKASSTLDNAQSLDLAGYLCVFRSLLRLQDGHHMTFPRVDIEPYLGSRACLQFYSIMLERGVTPDSEVYNVVLDILTAHNLDEVTNSWLLESSKVFEGTAQESFFDRNREDLQTAQANLAPSVALEIFEASNSVRPIKYKPETLQGLLISCQLTSNIDQAINIFDHFQKTGLRRTADIYRALLLVFSRVKDLPGAVECFNTWKAEHAKLPRHNHYKIYDAMIQCYFAADEFEGARKFFDAILDSNGQPQPKLLGNMIKYYTSAGRMTEAFNIAKEFSDESSSDYSHHLALIIRGACLQGKTELARSLYKEVRSLSALRQGKNAHYAYLEMLIGEGQLDEAKAFVLRCIRNGLSLRVVYMSSLVTKCLEAGRTADAFEFAEYLVQRRAVTNPREMNADHLRLFSQILLADIQRLNLVDATTIALCVETLYTCGKGVAPTETIALLAMIIKNVASEAWTAFPKALNCLCDLTVKCLPHSLHPNYDPQYESQTAPDSADLQAYIQYLTDALRAVKTAGFMTVIDTGVLLSLKNAAEFAQVDTALAELKTLLERSSTDMTTAQMSPQPSVISIFLAWSAETINESLSEAVRKVVTNIPRHARREIAENTLFDTQLLMHLENSRSQGQYVGGQTLLKLIHHYGRTQQRENLQSLVLHVEEVLPHLLIPGAPLDAAKAIVYDHALLAYNELFDNAAAQTYHDMIIDLGFMPSADAYASFVAKMDESRYRDGASRALALFNEAQKLGVMPNSYLMNTVIAKLAKARRNEEALSLFEQMKLCGLYPNGVTYGTVINSCCRVGKTEEAEALLVEMENNCRNQTRVAPYNTLIQHFVQVKKDRSKAFHYWDKLQRQAIPPTSHSFRLLIEAHGHFEPVDTIAAESILMEMQAKRVPVESIHHAAIIHMYGVVLKDLNAAKRHFDIWTGGPYPRTQPDSVLYQSIIEACVVGNDFTGMNAMLGEMQRRQIPLNAYIVNLAIRGFSKCDDLKQARALFDDLPTNAPGSLGKEPSTYETMIQAYNAASQPEKAEEVLHLLEAQNYPEAIRQHAASLVQPALLAEAARPNLMSAAA